MRGVFLATIFVLIISFTFALFSPTFAQTQNSSLLAECLKVAKDNAAFIAACQQVASGAPLTPIPGIILRPSLPPTTPPSESAQREKAATDAFLSCVRGITGTSTPINSELATNSIYAGCRDQLIRAWGMTPIPGGSSLNFPGLQGVGVPQSIGATPPGASGVSTSWQWKSPTRHLSWGTRGEDVRRTQQCLITWRFLSEDSATGFYGNLTTHAVEQFQCNENIVCTGTATSTGWGTIGAKTRAALARRCAAANMSTTGSTPTPTSPPGTNWMNTSTTTTDTNRPRPDTWTWPTPIPPNSTQPPTTPPTTGGTAGVGSCTYNGQTYAEGQTTYFGCAPQQDCITGTQLKKCQNGQWVPTSSTNTGASCVMNSRVYQHGDIYEWPGYDACKVSLAMTCPGSRYVKCTNGEWVPTTSTINTGTSCTYNGQTYTSGQSLTFPGCCGPQGCLAIIQCPAQSSNYTCQNGQWVPTTATTNTGGTCQNLGKFGNVCSYSVNPNSSCTFANTPILQQCGGLYHCIVTPPGGGSEWWGSSYEWCYQMAKIQ